MATTTPNLGLTKPTGSENFSRAILNGNMDLIDSAFFGRVAYTDIGSVASEADLVTALTSQIGSMSANGMRMLRFSATATSGVLSNGVAYFCELKKGASNTYVSANIIGIGTNHVISATKDNNVWSFKGLTLPRSNNFSGTNISVHRNGNVCTLTAITGYFSNSGATTQISLDGNPSIPIVLPNGYRPSCQLETVDTNTGKRIIVQTSGAVLCSTAITNTALRFSITYLTTNAYPPVS